MSEDLTVEFFENYTTAEFLKQTPLSIVITNPNLKDNPIVFANKAFEATTGYASSAVIGRNCRFLQGKETDEKSVDLIRQAIKTEKEVLITLLNYRVDGRTFWNELNLSPLYNTENELAYFLGIQRIVPGPMGKTAEHITSDLRLQEIQHRVKNHLSMVVSLIRTQARSKDFSIEEGYTTLARRVEALQLLYEQLNVVSNKYNVVDIGAYVGQLVASITHLNPMQGIRVNTQTDSADVSVDLAVQIGLILSEVLTNSFQHAFVGRTRGVVDINVKYIKGVKVTVIVEDDGVGMENPQDWPELGGSGSHIVRGMINFANAEVEVHSNKKGTRILINFPCDMS